MASTIDLLKQALPAGYSLGAQLGVGGQGAVFRGTAHGADVALKFFTSIDVERLKRELALLQAVRSPYIVELLDFALLSIQGQAVPMAVYRYVPGKNLREIINSTVTPSQADVLAAGEQVGEAIETLWASRIVHRDVKPENVMAADNGTFVLVDVGFAQHLNLTTITAAAGQPGTNGYRSPEQCGGRTRLTLHSDVFALGVTLFEYASGQHPWDRNQHAMQSVPAHHSLLTLRPDLDRRLCDAVSAMMNSRSHLRPSDPAERFRAVGRN